jgi:hypothetical protein
MKKMSAEKSAEAVQSSDQDKKSEPKKEMPSKKPAPKEVLKMDTKEVFIKHIFHDTGV